MTDTSNGSGHKLTTIENALLDDLGRIYTVFSAMDGHHSSDLREMSAAIHAAQRIIMCRVVRRANPERFA